MFLSNPKLIEEYRTPGGRKGFIFEGAAGERVVLCFDKGKVPDKLVPSLPAAFPEPYRAVLVDRRQAALGSYSPYGSIQAALGAQGQVIEVADRRGAVGRLFGGLL